MTTKPATAESTQEVFKEALKFYEDALKSGIELQEESLKTWKDLLNQVGSPEDLKKKLEALTKDVFPKNSARIEDISKVFQENAKQCTDLFSKTVGVYQSSSLNEGQDRIQDLMESSLTAMRSNVHSVVDTNSQVMKIWNNLLNKK